MIEMNNVHKWFGDLHVLNDVNLKVNKSEKIVICGPSGSGKSTLIRCINRLEEHQRGEIIVEGTELTNDSRSIERIRGEVGMVFQQFNLFPHLSILDNVTLAPIWVRKTPKAQAIDKAMEYLKRVQIDDQAFKYPSQLSGGQQQRAAIARAIIKNPKILVFDDCLSAVDTETEERILANLESVSKDKTTFIISHRVSSAKNADKIIILDDGEIIQQYHPCPKRKRHGSRHQHQQIFRALAPIFRYLKHENRVYSDLLPGKQAFQPCFLTITVLQITI